MDVTHELEGTRATARRLIQAIRLEEPESGTIAAAAASAVLLRSYDPEMARQVAEALEQSPLGCLEADDAGARVQLALAGHLLDRRALVGAARMGASERVLELVEIVVLDREMAQTVRKDGSVDTARLAAILEDPLRSASGEEGRTADPKAAQLLLGESIRRAVTARPELQTALGAIADEEPPDAGFSPPRPNGHGQEPAALKRIMEYAFKIREKTTPA